MDTPAELTQLLHRAQSGDEGARNDLLPRVYASLHAIADGAMERWDSRSTLQPTALVHEAYLKLFGSKLPTFADREHFLAVSANAMRNVLVDRARAKRRVKRGGEMRREPLDLFLMAFEERSTDILDLHAALEDLAIFAPDSARIVELRFFGGLSNVETARVLAVSERTVERDWRGARAWLYTRLSGDGRLEPA